MHKIKINSKTHTLLKNTCEHYSTTLKKKKNKSWNPGNQEDGRTGLEEAKGRKAGKPFS